jgi:endoglucanase
MRRLTAAGLALGALVSVGAATLAADPPEDSVAPLRGRRLHVDRTSPAARQADAWRRSRPEDAARMRHIADQPIALWLGNWTADIRREVDRAVSAITGAGELPVFVAYNIPKRDCGQHSAGGAGGADAYRGWIRDFARGIRARDAVVILEPDALPQLTCLPVPDQAERLALLREAVEVLRAEGAVVYIDAGHGRWVPAPEMAVRLSQAGVAGARGFSLNISNFQGTAVNLRYGEQLSRLTGGKHFIIDTSRNGRGGVEGSQWCNPRGQALGVEPTTQTGHPLADAFLWVKRPGESDGTCGGGPRAGDWWPEYALELSAAAETLGRVAYND